jgi:predicted nucleic acid-binding protein
MAQVVVLDAGVPIALYSKGDPNQQWAMELFSRASDWELQISALTQAEIMVHPARAGKLDQFQRSLNQLGLAVQAIEPADAADLARLRSTTNLKMPDVVVLHQAIKSGGAIATTDKALATKARNLGIVTFDSGSAVT